MLAMLLLLYLLTLVVMLVMRKEYGCIHHEYTDQHPTSPAPLLKVDVALVCRRRVVDTLSVTCVLANKAVCFLSFCSTPSISSVFVKKTRFFARDTYTLDEINM